jgi:hypothetical protein
VTVAATLAAMRRRGKSAPIRRSGSAQRAQKIPWSRAPMRVFRACPVPDSRLLGAGLPRTNSRPSNVRNSLVAGKNAGNFVELACFCENLSRKHTRIQ